jgi:RNA polymerase sigma-70 factor (ECF subfamily)
MARLAQGDRTAFDPLYAALRPRALRFASSRLGEADAPDVAQSALLRVFSRASEFTPGKPCLPWFYAIVANEIRSRARKRSLCSPHEMGDALVAELAAPDADAESQLLDRELERALELAIDGLDDEAAEAIRVTLGRAPAPHVKPPTFRKRVSRAYAKLRLLLGTRDAG